MMIKTTALFGSLLLLSACSSLTDFVRPGETEIVVGKSSRADIIAVYKKEPDATGQKLANGEMLDQIEYGFVQSDDAVSDSPGEPGYVAVKGILYFLKDNRLVGSDYYSTFAADSSKFDVSKITSIVKGKSTKMDVVKLLGRPSVILLKPLVSDKAVGAIGYNYRQMIIAGLGDLKTNADKVIFEYDENNIVIEIDYESKREKTS